MPLQKRLALIGFAKQAAKAAAAAAAAYDIGVLGGTIGGADISEDDLNPTAISRVLEDVDRTRVQPGASFDCVAMPKSIGLLLLAACGQVVTVAGAAGQPNVHTFTPSQATLPYLTVFGRYDQAFVRMVDSRLDTFDLNVDTAGAVKAKAGLMGCDLEFLASAYTIGASERPVGNKFIGAGGSASFDGAAARITKASVSLKNNLTPVPNITRITPEDLFPGMVAVDVSLTIVPDDLAAFRKTLTGSASGAAISGVPYTGGLSIKVAKDASTDLEFVASRATLLASFPAADPSGGPAEVEIAAKVLTPASGPAFTFTLRNDVAAY